MARWSTCSMQVRQKHNGSSGNNQIYRAATALYAFGIGQIVGLGLLSTVWQMLPSVQKPLRDHLARHIQIDREIEHSVQRVPRLFVEQQVIALDQYDARIPANDCRPRARQFHRTIEDRNCYFSLAPTNTLDHVAKACEVKRFR